MTKRQLLGRIEALEARVAELEARPQPNPWDTPKWAPLPRPTPAPLPDRWWDQLQGGIASGQPQNSDVRLQP